MKTLPLDYALLLQRALTLYAEHHRSTLGMLFAHTADATVCATVRKDIEAEIQMVDEVSAYVRGLSRV